jgi:hypothetical protein
MCQRTLHEENWCPCGWKKNVGERKCPWNCGYKLSPVDGLCTKPCIGKMKNTDNTLLGTITEHYQFTPGYPTGRKHNVTITWDRGVAQERLAKRLLDCLPGTVVTP